MTAGFNRECSWHQKDDFDMEIANVMTVVSHVSACVVQTLLLQSPGYNCTTMLVLHTKGVTLFMFLIEPLLHHGSPFFLLSFINVTVTTSLAYLFPCLRDTSLACATTPLHA